jgi:hypothetical protein
MISDSKWINSNPKHLQHVLHPCSMEFSLHGVTQRVIRQVWNMELRLYKPWKFGKLNGQIT